MEERTLVIIGAPRRNGYTRELATHLIRGLERGGTQVDLLDLFDQKIGICRGCYGCWSPGHPGRCVQNDDMTDLLERYCLASLVVLVTPVYYYSFSALTKTFIERLLPLTRPLPSVGPRLKLTKNALRRPDNTPRKMALLAVAAHRDMRTFEGVTKTFELIAEGMDAEPVGTLLRPESYFMDFPASKPVTMKKILGAFETAGLELARDGRVSLETEQRVSTHLTRDDDAFNRHFETYWAIAHELGSTCCAHSKIKDTAARDLRILMPELVDCFSPKAAGELAAIIHFTFSGKQPGDWTIHIRGGRCSLSYGAQAASDAHISCDSQTFVDIVLQKLDPRQALTRGEIHIDGDRKLFARFGRLFPPPSE